MSANLKPTPFSKRQLAIHIAKKKFLLRTLKTEKDYLKICTCYYDGDLVSDSISSYEKKLKSELEEISHYLYVNSLAMVNDFVEHTVHLIHKEGVLYENGVPNPTIISQLMDQVDKNSYINYDPTFKEGNLPPVIEALKLATKFAQDLNDFLEPMHDNMDYITFIVDFAKRHLNTALINKKEEEPSPSHREVLAKLAAELAVESVTTQAAIPESPVVN
jgi:hypothetical protein